MTIGERIKIKRFEKGYTLEELAKLVNTSKQTIHRYETGIIANIPSDKIELLAKALNVTPAYIMGWEENKAPLTPETADTAKADEETARIALFGGDNEVTDEMWGEVKSFVDYIKNKYNKD